MIQDWDIAPELKEQISIAASTEVSAKYISLVCEATRIIAPHVRPKKITVFFVRDVLTVNLTVVDRVAEYWRDIIVYNLAKVDLFKDDEHRLAVIFLEELVHAFYDTLDELVASKKVAELYPKVSVDTNTGNYMFPL